MKEITLPLELAVSEGKLFEELEIRVFVLLTIAKHGMNKVGNVRYIPRRKHTFSLEFFCINYPVLRPAV
jgi:hypothetical protein